MLDIEKYLKILFLILFVITIVLFVMATMNICPFGYAIITVGFLELVNLFLPIDERKIKFDILGDIIIIITCFACGVSNLIAAYR